MYVIDLEREINAPAQTVWQVLTDLGSYGEWNPFVVECRSTLEPGDVIDMKVRLIGPPQKQQEVMLGYDEGRGFNYRMKPFPLGALASFRSHEIVPQGESRCLYRSHFELRGWMMPLVRGLFGTALMRGFTGMTDGVKARAELLAGQATAA